MTTIYPLRARAFGARASAIVREVQMSRGAIHA